MNDALYGLRPEDVTKPPFFHLPMPFAQIFMYALAAVAVGLFARGFWRHARMWLKGQPDNRFDHLGERIKALLLDGFGQRKIRQKKTAGIAHVFVFVGFIFLFIGTNIVFVEYDILDHFGLGFWFGTFYLWYSLILDVMGIVFLLGLSIFIHRRYVKRPRHLGTTFDDKFLVALLYSIGVTGFLLEGVRMAHTVEPWKAWSPVGNAIALAFNAAGIGPGNDAAITAHLVIWVIHMVIVMGFIAYIPYSKLLHIITSPLNIFFKSFKPTGKIDTPFQLMRFNKEGELEENADFKEEDLLKGAYGKFEDLSWRQLLELDACTKCARCTMECPATLSGRVLSPMHFIQDLRNAMWEQVGTDMPESERRPLVGEEGLIHPDTLWSCTTCNACVNACPVMIEHVDFYMGMRRHLSNEQNLPTHVVETLKKIQNNFNPWGLASSDRMSWVSDSPIKPKTIEENPEPEVLYWIGCAGNFDQRNQNITKAILKIFEKAGVNYAILGKDEKCTAEVARRMGDEGTFQQFAFENIMTMNALGVKKIVTACPHCFNTFANEYPELGLQAKTVHHTEFIKDLIDTGRLKLDKKVDETLTYHDSCYLGRHNDNYDAPRELLKAAGVDLIEMGRSKSKGLCCGAGGANMWYEVPEDVAINKLRVQEAVETGAQGAATACPFCMFMFVDGQKKLDVEEKFTAQDVAEVVAKAIS
ncbi:MAG: heterodisulfide reductase-related iron-sulfur binding cluster [Bdellovibrionota bacterium]